jgi:ubiquinone/menaquinone biosynthesis C-methylase UbiE
MGTKEYETSIEFKYYWESLNTLHSYVSFLHQVKCIYDCKPQNVLEIGVGNKLTSSHLKNIGIKVTTLDINSKLKPDMVGDVRHLQIVNDSFDVVCAFEVLEHLPFEDFEKALLQMHAVSKKYVILSLPISKIGIEFSMWLPKIHHLYLYIDFPIKLKHKGVIDKNDYHYWEVNKKGYSKHKILNIFKKNFKVIKEYRPRHNQRHWFVVLEVIK